MSELRLFNTLGRTLETFKPLVPGKVGFYGCGPTVYNYAHLGNMRPYLLHDLLVRTLRSLGYSVTHVMNVTDVGHLSDDADTGVDKMVKRAEETGKSVWEIAAFYTEAFFRDTGRLGIARPDIVCKATDHIPEMIALIARLEAGGFTYAAGGNLYFDVSKFPDYGRLALLRLDDLKAGARVEVDPNKRHPADFALWFTKSKFEGQAMVWDSPWGRGYPGWHIECSAMSMKYLGEQFDIHAGGVDHIPIHHTNEIAQSEAATGKPWVKYWIHNEFLNFGKIKMAKSSGDFLTLQSVVDKGYDPLDYRYFLLGAHYRSQLQFSWENLDAARTGRASLLDRVLALRARAPKPAPAGALGAAASARLEAFRSAMADDLGTPRALAELHGLLKDGSVPPADVLGAAFAMDSILGLGLEAAVPAKEEAVDPALAARVEGLIAERASAKKAKDFARADALRAELQALGVVIADGPAGTTWRLGRP